MLQRVLAMLVDACTSIGVLIAVTGGMRFKHHAVLPNVSLMYFGPLFLPLAACLVFGLRPPGSRVLPLVDRLRARVDAWPETLRMRYVVASIIAVSITHALVVFLRHMSFQTGMDLAIYSNACRGALFSTMKGDVWLLADHFEPVLLLFTPLCRTISPAVALLAVQLLAFSVGALGMYKLARLQAWSPSQAWLASLLYLTFAPNVRVLYYDFHLIVLALGVTPWLWWALQAERYGWFIALTLLYLGMKESVSLTVFGLGAFLCLRKDRPLRRMGALYMVGSAALFLAIMKLVYPLFRNGEETMYFAKYYGHLGKNLNEFVTTLLTRPMYFISTLLVPSKLVYVAALTLPFLFLPFVRPLYWLPVALPILINILSNDENILARTYHYEAEIEPMLFASALVAFQSTRLRNLWLGLLLVGFTHESAIGIARWSFPSPAQRKLLAELNEHVPMDRAIAAPQRIAAHLTDREKLYMFDYWQMTEDWKRAELVVIGYHGDWLGWYSWKTLNKKVLPAMLPQLHEVYQSPTTPHFRIFEVLSHTSEKTPDVEPHAEPPAQSRAQAAADGA